jgi:hypothetical protein
MRAVVTPSGRGVGEGGVTGSARSTGWTAAFGAQPAMAAASARAESPGEMDRGVLGHWVLSLSL